MGQKRQEEELTAFEKKVKKGSASTLTTSSIGSGGNGSNHSEKSVQFSLSSLDLRTEEEKRKQAKEKERELEEKKAEEDAIMRKKEKNRLKKERKKQKEAEAQAAKQKEKEFLREIDPRLLELQNLRQQLAGENRIIKEILADGNCLYRAVADQLNVNRITKNISADIDLSRTTGKKEEWNFQEIRAIAGDYMEKHIEDFLPFMDYDDEAFGGGGGDNENM